jgi:glucose/arabinose dehydrogenase/cytochrome c553
MPQFIFRSLLVIGFLARLRSSSPTFRTMKPVPNLLPGAHGRAAAAVALGSLGGRRWLRGGFLAVGAAVAATTLRAQDFRAGTVAERYAQLCANCHGRNLEGSGTGPSLLKDTWIHGGDDESIARSIRTGFPEKGMPVWGTAIPEKEIRAMVIYLRETRAKVLRDQTKVSTPPAAMTVKSQLHDFRLETWIDAVVEPWSLAFLSPTQAIMTERRGFLYLIENGKLAARPISGLPMIYVNGQAGLMDVVPHPDYAANGWIYLSYSEQLTKADSAPVAFTRIIRGKLKDGVLVEQQTIFQAKLEQYIKADWHFGSRIAFDGKGHVFFSIGERGQHQHAQDLARAGGKIHRLHDDGRVPADNPFVGDPSAVPSIWSYGHRNPQGLAFSPATGELFSSEHGPRGGDELNLVRRGANYGWPVITYGMNYDGTTFTELTAKEGMEQPIAYWVPSLATCGINFYTGDLFAKWKNQLFLASLAAEQFLRIEIAGGKVVSQEVLFKDLGRIRHVITGPDGALYVLLSKRIVRLTPAS